MCIRMHAPLLAQMLVLSSSSTHTSIQLHVSLVHYPSGPRDWLLQSTHTQCNASGTHSPVTPPTVTVQGERLYHIYGGSVCARVTEGIWISVGYMMR